MRRGRQLAYLRFQLADYMVQRAAIALILVLFVAGIPLYGTLRGQPDAFKGPRGTFFAMQLFTGTVALFLPVGAFLGGTSIVSSDRQQGFFRFFFSKPVSVLAYYAQTFLLHFLAFVALFGAITWGYAALTVHVSVHRAMEAAALTFVLVGGLGFLLGMLTRFDGSLVLLLYVVSMMVQQVVAQSVQAAQADVLPTWLRQVARILPPVHTLDQLRNHLYAREALDQAQLWHVLGYGGGAFLLGFLALRNLPLSR